MPERLMLALLDRAEAWANRAGNTLVRRNQWTPAAFAVGRKPEERALLSAAAELGLNPEAGALPSHDALAARYTEHRARLADAAGGVA